MHNIKRNIFRMEQLWRVMYRKSKATRLFSQLALLFVEIALVVDCTECTSVVCVEGIFSSLQCGLVHLL